jgi:hypothetical protein
MLCPGYQGFCAVNRQGKANATAIVRREIWVGTYKMSPILKQYLDQFHNYCGRMKIVRCGFP